VLISGLIINQGPEPVLETGSENPIFCRVLGTGSVKRTLDFIGFQETFLVGTLNL
jgi:hypothetical protein